MNQYLDVNPEVAQAVAQGKPVVALESTIISHGMPYPQNVETALQVERIIRENGAVPATIAVLGGRLKAGLTKEEIEYLGKQGQAVTKASRRDLSVLVAQGADGGEAVYSVSANLTAARLAVALKGKDRGGQLRRRGHGRGAAGRGGHGYYHAPSGRHQGGAGPRHRP